MLPKEYFETKVPQNLKERADKIANINAVYEFQISGDHGGTWTLDLKTAGGRVAEGSLGSADCIVKMEDSHFSKLVDGELNAQMAFMSGKLKVEGNMGLALKLTSII